MLPSTLDSPPAFGCETPGHNARAFYQTQSQTPEGQEIIRNLYGVWPGPDVTLVELFIKAAQTPPGELKIRMNDASRKFGYIPFISFFVGVSRIRAIWNIPREVLTNKDNHYLRACIELISCGFILFIVDALVSRSRS